MSKSPLRIYATSAFVLSRDNQVIHAAYAGGSTSPQKFMESVRESWMKQFPREDGHSEHTFAPALEISQALIDDVIASRAQ